MQNSIFFAQLIGPVAAAFGLTMLLNRDAMNEMVDAALQHKAIIMMIGVPTLLAGLAIVNTHSYWGSSWPVAITIFGWLAVLGGLFRILLPGVAQAMGEATLQLRPVLPLAAVVLAGFGAFLTYHGYLA